MKRIVALMLALSLVLVGCESNQNTIAKFGKENWKEVISENFGFEISEPEGWAIESTSNNRTNKIDINFVLDGAESYRSYAEKMFNTILRSSEGKLRNGFDTSIELDSFEDACEFPGVIFYEYDMPDYTVEYYFYDNGGSAELTLNKVTKR